MRGLLVAMLRQATSGERFKKTASNRGDAIHAEIRTRPAGEPVVAG